MKRTNESDKLFLATVQADSDQKSLDAVITSLQVLRQGKPEERNVKSRRYAVALALSEQVYSYVLTAIVNEDDMGDGGKIRPTEYDKS